jgi:hypothetical protein
MRASIGMLAIVAAIVLPFERVVSDDRPSMTLIAHGVTFPYSESAIFTLPRERVALDVRGSASGLRLVDESGSGSFLTVAPNRWTWQAPAEPGAYELRIDGLRNSDGIGVTAFVMVSAGAVQQGFLNGYHIGDYPPEPLHGNPIYQPPLGFIEVTRETESARVSPHFRLHQFLSGQPSGFPKYLVLNEALVLVLEIIGRALEPLGMDANDIHVLNGFSTPAYNRAMGSVEYSLHQWGRAADIFVDHDRNGTMDDINNDNRIDRADAELLYDLLDQLSMTAEGSMIGGLAVYDATSAQGPSVHVDVRARKVRW